MNEQQIRKRNFISLTIEGSFFTFGLAFLDANSVVPVFIDTLTGSLQLAGLATTLSAAASMLTQLLVGPYIQKIRNMPAYITLIMMLFRPLPILMIPLLLHHFNPYLTVSLFLCLYSLLWASDGLIVVPWTDLFGRTIPGSRRGKLLGYQLLFGGIGSLLAGFIIKATLENNAWNTSIKYSIIFGLAGFILFLSAVAMSFAKDIPRKINDDKVNFYHFFGKLPEYFAKNKEYANMAYIRILSSFVGMILPFIILFGKNTFHLVPSQISTLIYIQLVGSLLGGLIWGSISHRIGNKYVILLSQILGLFLPGLAFLNLILQGSLLHFLVLWPMCIITGINMGSWMGFLNYTIDIVTEEERPIYLVLNSVITFPLSFLTYFAGLIADHWGFLPLFSIAVLSAVLSIALSLRLKSPGQVS